MRFSAEDPPVYPAAPATFSDLDKISALLTSPHFYTLAAAIPTRVPGSVGRPNGYPQIVYLLATALVYEIRSLTKTAATLGHPATWALVRHNIKSITGLELAEIPPGYYQIRRGVSALAKNHLALINETFTAIAVRQAQQQGCLNPSAPFSAARPLRGATITGDGKVLRTPINREAAQRRQQLGKPVPAQWRPYVEGGDKAHPVYGTKVQVMTVRSGNDRNQQLVLRLTPEPAKGHGGEAAVAVQAADAICQLAAGGVHTIIYDGAFRGVHIEHLITKYGVQVICPIAKNLNARFHDEIECDCGTTHQLWLRHGALHEREILDTGEINYTTCALAEPPKRHRNPGGTWRHYQHVQLSCGNTHREPIHRIDTDAAKNFNRAENLRQHAPGSPVYQQCYGWRENTESYNRLIADNLANRQVAGYTIDKQHLLLIGMALCRNAISWYMWQRTQPPPQHHAA